MNSSERTVMRYRMAVLLTAIVLFGGVWSWRATHGLEQRVPQPEKIVTNGSASRDDISVQTLTPELARWLGIPEWTRGVVVSAVAESSPWAAAGLQRADVILEANGRSITDEREFNSEVDEAGLTTILLLVQRAGEEPSVTEVVRVR